MRRLPRIASSAYERTQLLRLAQEIALAAQEQVLRQLLGDRRAADDLRRARRSLPAFAPGLRVAPLRCLARRRCVGALVSLPGLLERVPLDAAVLGEAAVLGGDHGALEVGRDAPGSRSTAGASRAVARLEGEPPRLRALERRRLRIDDRHQRDPGQEVELQRDERRRRRAAPSGAAAAARCRHATAPRHDAAIRRAARAAPARSRARRRARARTPRRPARPACRARRGRVAPCASAQATKARSRRPVHHVEREAAAPQDARPRPAPARRRRCSRWR